MKKVLVVSLILNVLLVVILISIFNTYISWEHNGIIYSHKLGDFYLERLRGE